MKILEILLNPERLVFLCFFLSLVLSALVRLFKGKWKIKIKKWSQRSWILAFACSIFFTSPLIVWIVNQQERAYFQEHPLSELKETHKEVQAVIILGGGTVNYHQEYALHSTHSHISRLIEGIKLYQRKQISYLILSGGDPHPPRKPYLGETLSSLFLIEQLKLQQAPGQRVLLENQSLNTYEEALILKNFLFKYSIKKSYLVTSFSHMRRSLAVFKKQHIDVIPYPVTLRTLTPYKIGWSTRNFALWEEWIHEWVGWIYYRWQGYL